MSKLGALLDRHGDALFARWAERLHELSVPTAGQPELRDHVPALLRELRSALRDGRASVSSAAAMDHGRRREESGFEVEAILREYRILVDVILDRAEVEGIALTIPEIRVVSEFVARAISESVSAHRRYHARVQQKEEETTIREHNRADVAQRRLDALFETAPAFMTALQGPSHVFTLVNEPYQRLVGVDRRLLGCEVATALPEVVPQGFIDLLDGVYRSGDPHVGREVLVRLDRGNGRLEDAYLDFVYQPTRGAAGEVDGIDVFGFDVTTQVRARMKAEALVEDLRMQEAELALVVDALPLLVSFVTTDERYGLVNKAYESWFNVSRDELRGRTVREVVGDAAYERLGPLVKRALAGERFSFEQYDVPYAKGGSRDIAVTFVPRRRENGTVEGYVAVLDDITARRRLEADRERLLTAERLARREEHLQREHLRELVATAPIGIATWRGPEHVFQSANDRYLGAFQKSPAVIGQPLATAFSDLPPTHPLFAAYDDVYRSGRPFVEPEYRITLVREGRAQAKVYVLHLTPVRDADGRIDGVMACVLDVTEVVAFRELVEIERDLATAVAALEGKSRDASEQARAQAEFLLNVARTLGESLELDVMLQRLVETIAPAHAAFASVWTPSSTTPWRRAHASFRAERVDAVASSSAGGERAAAIAVERVVATGETLRIDDYAAWMATEGVPEVGRALVELGIGPVLILPIRRSAEVIAVLSLAHAPHTVFSDDEVAVFESVARFAAFAVENARLFGDMVRLRTIAEEATVAKDRFLAHVSHDLRNPLNSILGWSSLLRG